MLHVKLQCPACHWQPDGKPYWQCHCGHVWDTFKTGGRCPECKFQHNFAQCIQYAGGCSNYSLLLDWYQGLDEMVSELVASTRESA